MNGAASNVPVKTCSFRQHLPHCSQFYDMLTLRLVGINDALFVTNFSSRAIRHPSTNANTMYPAKDSHLAVFSEDFVCELPMLPPATRRAVAPTNERRMARASFL